MQGSANKSQTVVAETAPTPDRPGETTEANLKESEPESEEEHAEAEQQRNHDQSYVLAGAESTNEGSAKNPESESAARPVEDEIPDAEPRVIQIAANEDP